VVGEKSAVEGALPVSALPGAHRRPHQLVAEGRFAAAGAPEDEGASRLGRVPLLQAVRQLHERPFSAVEAFPVQKRLSHPTDDGTVRFSRRLEHLIVSFAWRAHFCNRKKSYVSRVSVF
jgi:hypothetical protein